MGLSADEGSVSMSERLTQEVLERAWHAAYDAFSGELLNDLETPNHAVAVAAMRAVLEGHLAARCDNELTRKVDGKMTDYVCGLPWDHEGSCQWRQVLSGAASDGSPR